MKNNHIHFFKPYAGVNYNEGIYDLRSLVVGVCHICDLECPYHDKCTSSELVRDMDHHCPCYKDRENQDYYTLSNSNAIEIESFLETSTKYPAYKIFTYYMLKCAGDLPSQKKHELWDNVAFTNFLQYFHNDGDVLPKDPALFEQAYPAFKEIVDELRPQVIYVWNEQIRQCLKKHKSDFNYMGKADMQCGISLFLFSPLEEPVTGNKLARLHYHLGISSENHRLGWYKDNLEKHIGASYNTQGDKRQDLLNMAEDLKSLVDDYGILKTTETQILFNDSEKGKWTSLLKGIFLSALKDQYPSFGQGFNPGIAKLFNEKNIATCKNDTNNLKDNELRLAQIIKRTFTASKGKTFSKDGVEFISK